DAPQRVEEGEGGEHHDRGEDSRDHSIGQNGLSHRRPPGVNAGSRRANVRGTPAGRVILSGDSQSSGAKSSFQGRRRAVLAIWTASVRRFAPSLSKRRLAWVFTEFSLTKRRVPISLLLRPSAI